MHPLLVDASDQAAAQAVPVHVVTASGWRDAASTVAAAAVAFADAQGYDGAAGKILALPGPDGSIAAWLFGADTTGTPNPFHAGRLATSLPAGVYRLEGLPGHAHLATLSILLSAYRFTRYRARNGGGARFVVPAGVDAEAVSREAEAVAFGRDLINTPSNDMGPAELENHARALTARCRATIRVTTGDDLLADSFPLIHAVGRGSARAPRLIDITWGDPAHPRVTLVGKGVCFDTGGLNLKTDAGMLLMKKDMGGAATALAAARIVMEAKLPVRLRVLVPAVENSVSGTSFRPGDILKSRKGLTVEIGNTDAEGRLILADALALADEEEPALLVDFATLTGAARVALGPDLPPVYTDDETLAADIVRMGSAVNDPVWRMPLWSAYDAMIDSKIADMNNVSGGSFAGSVVAALFLRRFVEKAKSWAHFDIFGWVPSAKPGRPEGGEPQAARLVAALLHERFPPRP
ncbi:leucyl aminopeptidase family protein [Alsobacter sp. R-9]